MRKAGEDKVYLAQGLLQSVYAVPLEVLRDKTILRIPDQEVQSIVIRDARNKKVILERKGDTWNGGALSSGDAATLATNILSLDASGFPEDSKLATAVASFDHKIYISYTHSGKDETATLLLKSKDGRHYALRQTSEDTLFEVASTLPDLLSKQLK